MKFQIVLSFAFLFCCVQVQARPEELSRQDDDAIIVESSDTGTGGSSSSSGLSTGSTTNDGPGPSLLGSLNNIFKSVKDFDQYKCIERMVCEYMQSGDASGISGLIGSGSEGSSSVASGISSLTGGSSSSSGIPGLSALSGLGSGIPGLSALAGIPGLSALTGGGASTPVRGQFDQVARPTRGAQFQQFQQGSFDSGHFTQGQFAPGQLRPGQFDSGHFTQGQFAPGQLQPGNFDSGHFQPNRFQQGQFNPQFQQFQTTPAPGLGESFLNTLEGIFLGKRRRIGRQKRQTQLQGNLIRLMQATKLDNLSAFPYIRAALVGNAAKGQTTTRAGSGACSQLYRECPTEANQILNYINNHNGGLVNQVQPSVDNEVAPILSSIVGNLVGGETDKKTSSSTSSPTFAAADSFITNAIVQGASGPFKNALNSLTEMITGTKS